MSRLNVLLHDNYSMCCVLDWHKFYAKYSQRPIRIPLSILMPIQIRIPILPISFAHVGKSEVSSFFLSRHHRKCHNFQYFGQYIRQNYTDPTGSGFSTFLENLNEQLSKSEWQVVTKHLCTVIEPKERARQMSRLLKFQFLRVGKTHFESR